MPKTPAVLPVPMRSYYAWQALFTFPVGVGATGLGLLVAWGIARVFGSDTGLDALWGLFGIALVVPTFVTMWVPETAGLFVAARGATITPFPDRFDLGRIVVGSVWSGVLAVVAVLATGVALPVSLVAGLAGAALAGAVMALVLR